MKRDSSNIRLKIRQVVHSVDPDARVILYGSRARKESRKESDWDILILVNEKVTDKLETNIREKIYDLELESGELISVFIYSESDWRTRQYITPFYHNVTREGVSL